MKNIIIIAALLSVTVALGQKQIPWIPQKENHEAATTAAVRTIQLSADRWETVPEDALLSLLEDPFAAGFRADGSGSGAGAGAGTGAGQSTVSQLMVTHFQSQKRRNQFGPGFMDVTAHYPADMPTAKEIEAVRERVQSLWNPDPSMKPRFPSVVLPLLEEISGDRLAATIRSLSEGFFTRHHKSSLAVSVAEFIQGEFDQLIVDNNRTEDITTELFYGPSSQQPSVIVKMRGQGGGGRGGRGGRGARSSSSSSKEEEIVVLGAHEDSISSHLNVEARAPGADDDASGVACVLEVFRVLVESGFRPNRTVHFMAYAGEEAGLLGSKDIARAYTKYGLNVVAMLQVRRWRLAVGGCRWFHHWINHLFECMHAWLNVCTHVRSQLPLV